MKVVDGIAAHPLRPRTRCAMSAASAAALADADGFVDTGDIVELRGDRYYFVGRRGGIINVGGLKVHPEEVEAVINRHPDVRMSLVRSRKNPITGAVVVADVVLRRRPRRGAAAGDGAQARNPASLPRGTCRSTRCRRRSASCRRSRSPRPASWRGMLTMRNVVVTGGSRGLGLGIASKLAAPAIASSRSRAR